MRINGRVYHESIFLPGDHTNRSRYLRRYWQMVGALFLNHISPVLQQIQSFDHTLFMLDGAPLHIDTLSKKLLSAYFEDNRIVRYHFPATWLPRFPQLKSVWFLVLAVIEECCLQCPNWNLADSMASITHHIHCISNDTLRSAVERIVLCFTS